MIYNKFIKDKKKIINMVHSGFAQHHIHKKKKNEPTKLFDKLVYLAGLVTVILTLPQIKNIWIDKNAAGVSALTWGTYFAGAIVWFSYGIVHKEKPIIYMYLAWMILDALVFIGALIY